MAFSFHLTDISEVQIIIPDSFGDERGFFMESYKKSVFKAHNIKVDFVQDNHSSSSIGVLRGLHYQRAPQAQGKLVRCISGSIFDVAVDIRRDSLTFKKWIGVELSAENKRMLYIPPGFAHGYLSLSEKVHVLYKTTAEYAPALDSGIIWNDPEIAIKWPMKDVILSDKNNYQFIVPIIKDDSSFIYSVKVKG